MTDRTQKKPLREVVIGVTTKVFASALFDDDFVYTCGPHRSTIGATLSPSRRAPRLAVAQIHRLVRTCGSLLRLERRVAARRLRRPIVGPPGCPHALVGGRARSVRVEPDGPIRRRRATHAVRPPGHAGTFRGADRVARPWFSANPVRRSLRCTLREPRSPREPSFARRRPPLAAISSGPGIAASLAGSRPA